MAGRKGPARGLEACETWQGRRVSRGGFSGLGAGLHRSCLAPALGVEWVEEIASQLGRVAKHIQAGQPRIAMIKGLRVSALPGVYALCHLPAEAPLPEWARLSQSSQFASVTRTSEELSLLIPEEQIPLDVKAERGLRAIKVLGPLPLDAIGILAGLAQALAAKGIAIIAVSTYDTDYILVKAESLPSSLEALSGAGCGIV